VSNSDQAKQLLVAEASDYAIITLNRPAQMNSLSWDTMEALEAAIKRLRNCPRFRVIIITGAGGIFSVGADLNEVAQLTPVAAFDFSRRGQATLNLLSRRSAQDALTIAAIDGHCLGGGLDLALACDLRLAAPRSTFAHPGAKRGIITGWGGTARLPRLIGRTEALRLLLTGDRIDAQEALRIGLVNELCDAVIARACEMARTK
jgi:enoyl-CoA hydratase